MGGADALADAQESFHFVVSYAGYQARSGNRLWDLYQRGITNSDKHMYTFWRSGPDANLASWITPAYLESQRRRLPDHIFRRLHYNEWSVAADSKVFRIAPETWSGTFQDSLQGSTYVVGLDLAKLRDFTSWSVLRTDVDPIRLVDCGKLPHMDYSRQADLLAAKVQRFGNPRVLVDSSGPGQSVVEMLRERGLAVEEFVFTNESKAKVVTDVCVAFEQRKIALPKAGRTIDESRAISDLELELFNFEPTVLKSGNLRYEAAGNFHDDMVISLTLAWALALEAQVQPWALCVTMPFGASPLTAPSFAPSFGGMTPSTAPPKPIEEWDVNDPGPEYLWRPM